MRGLPGIICAVLLFNIASAQNLLNKSATDAFLITRMSDKFHLQPKPVNAEFSTTTFDRLLESLDDEKIFFTQEDITLLQPYRSKLDVEVLGKKTDFLQLLAAIYEKRLKQTDTLIDLLTTSPFEFTSNEKLTVAENDNYAANTAALKIKLKKLFKANVLNALLNAVLDTPKLGITQQKKFTDSLEIVYRKKTKSGFKRFIKKDLESPGGIAQIIGEAYCETIATYYDPHTNYFSITSKENFESELGQKSMMFGFGLDEDDEGNVVIADLKPGSPAYQSGQLNEGDKIQSIQWQGKEAIDVSDASLSEIGSIIDASNHDKAKIIVKKADGTKREVELAKVQMEDDSEADKVKSFILKGKKTVGYISLPAFYEDWENEENNVNGCANDVAREILKLKKDNIEALVLDLRYNGGGSVQEAVELAGIFIDAGPVAQVKGKEAKVFTLKDANRGLMYEGPLFIMVNGYSASASELVAGTLQDYNRAVIVGSSTYGKATGQTVLPMDTTISMDKDFSQKKASSYIKMTLSKLYRINGTTAQFSGVQPDIVLPDIIEADPQRESNETFAIPSTGIEANKYYKPLPALNKNGLQQVASSIADTSSFFKTLTKYIAAKKAFKQKTDVLLNWKEALSQRQKNATTGEAPSYTLNNSRFFSVANNQYEQQRLQGNKDLKEMNDAWKAFLEKDPYLQITYEAAISLINKP